MSESTERTAAPRRRSALWGVLTFATRGALWLVATLAAIAILPSLAFGWPSSVVQSGSMEPGVHRGDVVLTVPVPVSEPLPLGRVIAFDVPAGQSPNGRAGVRLHRIVADGGDDTVITQGDANASPDSTPVARSQVIGEARLLVPKIGLPTIWVAQGEVAPLALFATATAIALVLVGVDLSPRSSSPARKAQQNRRKDVVNSATA